MNDNWVTSTEWKRMHWLGSTWAGLVWMGLILAELSELNRIVPGQLTWIELHVRRLPCGVHEDHSLVSSTKI